MGAWGQVPSPHLCKLMSQNISVVHRARKMIFLLSGQSFAVITQQAGTISLLCKLLNFQYRGSFSALCHVIDDPLLLQSFAR